MGCTEPLAEDELLALQCSNGFIAYCYLWWSFTRYRSVAL